MFISDPRLQSFPTDKDLPSHLWAFLTSREVVAAAEAFTDAELPAVAGLSGLLLRAFPEEVGEEQFRMTIGWGLKRVMEHLGYDFVRKDVQINLPGVFSTGALYVRKGHALRDRSQRIRRPDRDAWAAARTAKAAA